MGRGLTKTELKIKAIFESGSQKGWTYQKEKKKAEEEEEAEESGDHASSALRIKAVLWKEGFAYAQRGHDFIEGNGGRNASYKDFPHTHLVFDTYSTAQIKEKAVFPGGMQVNFNPGAKLGHRKKAGQKYPYPWEAHHMIPLSAFTLETASGPVFSWNQYRLLLMSEYDINHGHNMIMLPGKGAGWAVPFHSHVQHPSDHRQYTIKVQTELQKVSSDLKKLEEKPEAHEDLEVKIFDDLKNLEDTLWKLLIKLSRAVVAGVLAGQQVNSDLVKYEAATTGTQYQWGALA